MRWPSSRHTGHGHELATPVIGFRHGLDVQVVFRNTLVQMVQLAQAVADRRVGPTRQIFQMKTRFAAHHLGFLRQDNAELREQSSDAPRPMVRAGARLHANQARRQFRDQFHQRIAPDRRLVKTALPEESMPCTAKTFLARSMPIAIMVMDFPFRMNN
jgi:hypothetical protein